jgi:hypothetical protein
MPYREKNDWGVEILPFASNTSPSDDSLEKIAALAKANLLLRLPLMRVKEYSSKAMPNWQLVPAPPVIFLKIQSLIS